MSSKGVQTLVLAAASLMIGACKAATGPDLAADRAAVEQVILSYERGINTGDTALIVALFAADAVWKPNNVPAVEGKDAIRQRYERELARFTLKKTYTIHDLILAGDWAFVRTTSAGTVGLKETGQTALESHEDVFFLNRQQDGSWKIARYIYNSNIPHEPTGRSRAIRPAQPVR